ncbi:MAG: hypothetical protein V1912_03880 [bacterium]
MVIDTIKDVVIGDIGDEVVNTAGVAVRPFWWSTECLEALGLATGGGGTEGETTSTGGSSDTAVGGSGETVGSEGESTSDGGEATGGAASDTRASVKGDGLSGGWIALIAVLAVVAVAALAGLAFMIGRGRRGGGRIEATAGPVEGGPATSGEAASEQASGGAASTGAATAGAATTEAATQTAGQEAKATPPFCSQCGSPLHEGMRFCANCAKPV